MFFSNHIYAKMMIYRRLFHTRVSFASRYIVNFAVIIRVSFVYRSCIAIFIIF